MKKRLAYLSLALSMIFFTWACASKNNLTSPSSLNTLVSAKDAAPVTVVVTQTFSNTVQDGMPNGCSGDTLDCSGAGTVNVTLAPGQMFQHGSLTMEGQDPSCTVNGDNVTVISLGGDACGGVDFDTRKGGEGSDLSVASSFFTPQGPNVITFTFSGCVAYSFGYTYSTAVTIIETPTPSANTPTNTPVPPTATFTPVPPTPTFTPCGGGICTDAAAEERQCNSQWASIGMGGLNLDDDDICDSGCLLTSLAMANRTTPDKLNQTYSDAGDYNDTGGLLMDRVANSSGVFEDEIPAKLLSDDELVAGLCNKEHVVALVTHPGTHYVLVTGRKFDPNTNRCRVTVNDPNNASIQFLDDSSYTGVVQYTILSTSPLN